MEDDIGAVLERSEKGGCRDGGVDDQGDAAVMGQVGHGFHVDAGLLRVGGHLRIQETRIIIRKALPFGELPGLGHPSHPGPAFPHPHVE